MIEFVKVKNSAYFRLVLAINIYIFMRFQSTEFGIFQIRTHCALRFIELLYRYFFLSKKFGLVQFNSSAHLYSNCNCLHLFFEQCWNHSICDSKWKALALFHILKHPHTKIRLNREPRPLLGYWFCMAISSFCLQDCYS